MPKRTQAEILAAESQKTAKARAKIEAAERDIAHRKLMLDNTRYYLAWNAERALAMYIGINPSATDPNGKLVAARDFLGNLVNVAVASALTRPPIAPSGQEEADGVV